MKSMGMGAQWGWLWRWKLAWFGDDEWGDGCREEMRAELIGVVVMVEARVRMAGAMVERWWQLERVAMVESEQGVLDGGSMVVRWMKVQGSRFGEGLGDGYEGFLCAKTITMV
ncbi:hypothetical protein V6N11_034772 [Hibiscus sabdariffa]|uniref:Uncharacterized protein n=1 Tax=Hibiscus sabdariffa TaxID=183260 RepID=A0ABR2NRS1_9ROSI